jgi:hypothetical protein
MLSESMLTLSAREVRDRSDSHERMGTLKASAVFLSLEVSRRHGEPPAPRRCKRRRGIPLRETG